jgi:transposase
MVRLDQETDVEILRQAAKLLENENRRLVSQIVELTRELNALKDGDPEQLRLRIAELEQQIARRNQQLYGDSSERREGTEGKGGGAEPKEPQKGHGPREQPKLPIVEVIHELDEPDKICRACGGELQPWEGGFEESEEIGVVERHFVIKKHRRQKYRCRCNSCIETAPGPLKLSEGGRYSVDFGIEVAVNKYEDHQPLERQVRIMHREGLTVDSQTLWDQIERIARLLSPAYNALVEYVLSKEVIGADETRWRLLGAKGKPEGEASRWQVWAAVAPDAVIYQIRDSRSAEAARAVLEGFEGTVMCDGYSAYKALAKLNSSIKLAHCWAHVRREFVEIQSFYPQEAGEILDLIGELYAVEALCPAGSPGDTLRAQLRTQRSRGIVERIKMWATISRALPESALGKAIAYMSGIWSGLVRFLDDPRIPIDNNATERALRGVVVGRKNHYGSRSKRGTEVAALFYSLIETAKLSGMNSKAYLRRAIVAALCGETVPLPIEVKE